MLPCQNISTTWQLFGGDRTHVQMMLTKAKLLVSCELNAAAWDMDTTSEN